MASIIRKLITYTLTSSGNVSTKWQYIAIFQNIFRHSMKQLLEDISRKQLDFRNRGMHDQGRNCRALCRIL